MRVSLRTVYHRDRNAPLRQLKRQCSARKSCANDDGGLLHGAFSVGVCRPRAIEAVSNQAVGGT